jgi:hypothetical protein
LICPDKSRAYKDGTARARLEPAKSLACKKPNKIRNAWIYW